MLKLIIKGLLVFSMFFLFSACFESSHLCKSDTQETIRMYQGPDATPEIIVSNQIAAFFVENAYCGKVELITSAENDLNTLFTDGKIDMALGVTKLTNEHSVPLGTLFIETDAAESAPQKFISKALLNKNIDIVEFFKSMQLAKSRLDRSLKWSVDNETTAEQAAYDFLKHSKSTWKKWFATKEAYAELRDILNKKSEQANDKE